MQWTQPEWVRLSSCFWAKEGSVDSKADVYDTGRMGVVNVLREGRRSAAFNESSHDNFDVDADAAFYGRPVHLIARKRKLRLYYALS